MIWCIIWEEKEILVPLDLCHFICANYPFKTQVNEHKLALNIH